MRQDEIDDQVFELYDEYCHGNIDRREFFRRAGQLTVAGASAIAMAEALLPNYAEAQEIQFTDERIKANYVTYPSPGGNSGEMRGYLVALAGTTPPRAEVLMSLFTLDGAPMGSDPRHALKSLLCRVEAFRAVVDEKRDVVIVLSSNMSRSE